MTAGSSPAGASGSRDRLDRFPSGTVAAFGAGGKERWRVSTDGYAWTPPTVGGDRVYVARNFGNGVTAFSTGGDHVWSYSFAEDHQPLTWPLVRDGTVYVGDENEIVAIEERI